jgi:putative cell wall-binding protein
MKMFLSIIIFFIALVVILLTVKKKKTHDKHVYIVKENPIIIIKEEPMADTINIKVIRYDDGFYYDLEGIDFELKPTRRSI